MIANDASVAARATGYRFYPCANRYRARRIDTDAHDDATPRDLSTGRFVLFLVLSITLEVGSASADLWELANPQLTRLRQEAAALQAELETLDSMSLGTTADELGAQFHMASIPPTIPPFVQLDLGFSQMIDSVMVVPALSRVEAGNALAYAFPKSFRVDASDDQDFLTFQPLAVFEDTDFEATNGLPLVVRAAGTKARYLRVTVNGLAEIAERWTYALGEIIVLQGNRNVAIGSKVTMRLSPRMPEKWNPQFLVDGRTPLGPPIVVELPNFDGVYCAPEVMTESKWMMVDLGQEMPIDDIRLQPIHARQGSSFPGYSFPRRFRLEIADEPTFADSEIVFDSGSEVFSNPGSNPVTFSLPSVDARYVRVTCLETSLIDKDRFGLSELQVYSGDENVARNAEVTISHPEIHTDAPELNRDASLLVDGYASYGPLIELPEWVDMWDRYRTVRRAIGDTQRQENAALSVAYSRGFRSILFVTFLSLMAAGVWLYRRSRQRLAEKRQFRMKLAQDLHDEIGSNLAAIARLGEVAELETDPQQSSVDWQSVRQLALECTDSMRQTLWLLGGPNHESGELSERLKRATRRMLPDVTVNWDQDEHLPSFNENKEFDRQLFLTFKEIIANVAKHARATEVGVALTYANNLFGIAVQDNGVGFANPGSSGMGISNIRQRVTKLHGKVEFRSEADAGTLVQIQIPVKK